MRGRYANAHPDIREADVVLLRESLDFGSEWTREAAHKAWGWNDRRFRIAVATLREQGYPVVSMSDGGSVYRKARTRMELNDFIERELVSRTRTIEGQIRALREGADYHFGTPQLRIAI